jgi:4-amino-4-deoxy-L-arabinose transferase-like glycosyltransferase
MYTFLHQGKEFFIKIKAISVSPYGIAALLVSLVVIGSLLRINVFDSSGDSFYHVDVTRDYLIASHIVEYGDLPLTGPDGYFGPNSNSPVYYYIIALLLLLSNAVLFPGLVNVFLQAAAIPLVYLLGKELFSRRTGLAAAALFTFFDGVVAQAMQMWQPHLMQFFLLGSFLFLIYGYKKDRELFLYASSGLLAFSAILHSSVLAIVPVQLGAILYILWKKKQHSVKKMILAIGTFAAVLACSYIPTVYYFLQVEPTQRELSPYDLLYHPPVLPDPSVPQIALQALERVVNLFTYFFEGSLTGATGYTYVCMGVFLLGSSLYVMYARNTQRKTFFLLLFAGFFLTVFAVGSLKLTEGGFPVRYYTPVFVPFLLLIAEMLALITRKLRFGFVVYAVAIICIAYVGSEYARSRFDAFPSKLHHQGLSVFYPPYTWQEDINALAAVIKEDPSIDFDIRTFEKDFEHLYKNELVWVPLELILQKQLVHIDTATFRGYAVMNDPQHMFIRCIDMDKDLCKEQFMRKYSEVFRVESVVYESDTVTYLYARKI